jgi:hypothetical protein
MLLEPGSTCVQGVGLQACGGHYLLVGASLVQPKAVWEGVLQSEHMCLYLQGALIEGAHWGDGVAFLFHRRHMGLPKASRDGAWLLRRGPDRKIG